MTLVEPNVTHPKFFLIIGMLQLHELASPSNLYLTLRELSSLDSMHNDAVDYYTVDFANSTQKCVAFLIVS